MSHFDAGEIAMPPSGSADTQRARSVAPAILRGTRRHFEDRGAGCLLEFTLKTGRRADLVALFPDGQITIVEIKSSVADFRADSKWHHYLEYCDRFYFAVDETFPIDILPCDSGLIVADAYEAAVIRAAPDRNMTPARRKALTLRFALTAAARLQREG